MIEQHKTCTKCGQDKALDSFPAHKGGALGRRARCRVCHNETRMAWIETNRDSVREKGAVAASKRREDETARLKHRASSMAWYERNAESVALARRARWTVDPVFRMLAWQRTTLHRLLHNERLGPGSECSKRLGYTAAELRDHIESLFTEGMHWGIMGSEIHIDHIKPVAAFVREGMLDPKVINALSNLRPLWAEDNRRKAAKHG